ncbi:MAG: shikimate kinase [Porphyromonas sp.]|nr:shikimate kinase [Porphyromonas sp.]
MKPIFIIGFTGVGKTTVGKELAKRLDLNFIDTDDFIASRYNTSIDSMFATCGIEKFRKREKVVLIELSQKQNSVIATGGGLATYSDNMDLMLERGTVIYLEAPTSALAKRLYLVRESRPAVADKDEAGVLQYVEEWLPKRLPTYERANFRVDATHLTTDDDVSKVVDEIISLIDNHH